MSLTRELSVALDAVHRASLICQSVQFRMDSLARAKDDKSPVTVADFASQAAVCRVIGDAFPHDPIIAEEDAAFLKSPGNEEFMAGIRDLISESFGPTTEGDLCTWIDRGRAGEYSDRFWTFDPIDGTKGFLRREQYAVSLALIIDGRIQLGVLGCPNLPVDPQGRAGRGALFSAVRGEGAMVRPLDAPDTPPKAVRVSGTGDLSAARICESVESGHSAHGRSAEIAARLGMTHGPIRLDSQAKYAVVARGEADIYLRLPTRADYRERIWDHAGGVILVEEAGGKVSDVEGRPLEFIHGRTLEKNRGVIVTNGSLHDRVLSAVHAVLGGGPADGPTS